MSTLKVGDKVQALREFVIDGEGCYPDVHVPAGTVLIVREVAEWTWSNYYVSHEDVTDNSFGVKASEIEALK